jgi:hypothetical protein
VHQVNFAREECGIAGQILGKLADLRVDVAVVDVVVVVLVVALAFFGLVMMAMVPVLVV